jgi:AAA domain
MTYPTGQMSAFHQIADGSCRRTIPSRAPTWSATIEIVAPRCTVAPRAAATPTAKHRRPMRSRALQNTSRTASRRNPMVDVMLMRSLMKVLPVRTAVLIVGDIDQLPSVGLGLPRDPGPIAGAIDSYTSQVNLTRYEDQPDMSPSRSDLMMTSDNQIRLLDACPSPMPS